MTNPRKKLIEVALPLPEVNDASAYDKMPGIGPHPKGIHHWWARLPLPTARAVLFASVVDDPSEHPENWPTADAQDKERERLFGIIRRMIQKKLHEHPEVYAEARKEMLKHCDGALPNVYDPFAGGGSIPLEANRLGFEAHAGELNPVAVLLNKCNLEIAPQWAGRAPVNPTDRRRIGGEESWPGTKGLAADIRYYSERILERAREKIGHLYPTVQLPKDHGGRSAEVIAWIWARTVASPDPSARGVHVPLVSTFWLSSNKGAEAWLDPVVDKSRMRWRFDIRTGVPENRTSVGAGTKTGRAQFRCLLTGTPISDEHIKAAGRHGQLGVSLIAIVANRGRGRAYLRASNDQEAAAQLEAPSWKPEFPIHGTTQYLGVKPYGMEQFYQLFTHRQLTALVTLSDLIREARSEVEMDSKTAGLSNNEVANYARAVDTFLALAIDRCADFNNSLCRWSASNQKVMNLFGRQAIPMIWDFAEANILVDSVGGFGTCSAYVASCTEIMMAGGGSNAAEAHQVDAASGANGIRNLLVSTDPPYYDNIPYSNLSDFFYVWLRRNLGDIYPELFSTVLVPKIAELTAAAERFDGDKKKAKEHFEIGFRRAFTALRDKMDPRFPLTVYYAFKQADEESRVGENGDEESSSIDLTTGWETLLEALIGSGFQITATWPVRASQKWRMRAMGSNALASYIVLACRPRVDDAPETDRRTFLAELKRELPSALKYLQQGNVLPVDFAQAAIGPGMAIYSQYQEILDTSGKAMKVRDALYLINQTLTEILSEQDDDFDADTRWAISWFQQYGFGEGDYGEAELLSKAKVTSVEALNDAGFIRRGGGKVRLLKPEELPEDWNPATDGQTPIWEMTHHLVRVYYHNQAGDQVTAELLSRIGSRGELARELAYRLFDVCEKKKRSQEAQAYNALVLGWPEIARLSRGAARPQSAQPGLFELEKE